ncbi:hypothetical protein LOTGIDRAFT_231570 [Lottia gigantea]|uniref:Uncharacterized protein n=1 Tax=Lottia gigantea TaxID=225164 RepID=V4A0S0_LOTGI|nr:hypothetical protein LOTGIDRAFT_231570 [Lottia gigantea]ESO97393.1 hypothetical protein LOTGIDRAFT_231570 [Lottia gigantea]
MDKTDREADERNRASTVLYGVSDIPPWHITLLLGCQVFLTCLGGTFAYPLIISGALCLEGDTLGLAQVIGTVIFVSGLSTLIQTFFGIRLPIVQSCSPAFITPVFSLMAIYKPTDCPFNIKNYNETLPEIGGPVHREIWQTRIIEVTGAIMIASLFQLVIGCSGLLGVMLRFIGPLTVTPTIAMIGLSIFNPAYQKSENQWWIAITTVALIVIFSQYIMLAIVTAWVICIILTASGALPDDKNGWGYKARTDVKIAVLEKADWFRFPYPGQWGMPTISLAGVFGMLAGVFATIVESVGDYYACARLANAPPPPGSAVSRGIGMEGVACVIGAGIGSPGCTTSYSENIGAIGITKVGSRIVTQVGAVIMLFLGCFTKFGALFVTLPDSIVGGLFFVMFGMVTAVGLSNLQFVNLNSSRNLFVIGVPLVFALSVPTWLKIQSSSPISTGSVFVDQIFTVLLSTNMFVAGLLAFFLDNTIPGSDEERGIKAWRETDKHDSDDGSSSHVYDIPFLQKYLDKLACSKYVPILPNFKGDKSDSTVTGCCKQCRSPSFKEPEVYV